MHHHSACMHPHSARMHRPTELMRPLTKTTLTARAEYLRFFSTDLRIGHRMRLGVQLRSCRRHRGLKERVILKLGEGRGTHRHACLGVAHPVNVADHAAAGVITTPAEDALGALGG